MRIILLDKIKNLGNVGEEINVKSGYARNYLIPTAKAILATKENIASFEAKRMALENNLIKTRLEAESRISKIKKIGLLIIKSKSSISGKLFGSIGTSEISNAIFNKSGVKISKYNIFLPDGKKIRTLGEYNILIKLHHDVSAVLNVHIVNIIE